MKQNFVFYIFSICDFFDKTYGVRDIKQFAFSNMAVKAQGYKGHKSEFKAATDWEFFMKNHVNLEPDVVRIIGGNEAEPHSYPFIVGLLINGNSFCGGSLISQNYVLTAAHCGIVISTVEVILGAHNITADEESQIRIAGADVIIHENFNLTSYQNDIAIIKLRDPATINENIQLATLPPRSDADNEYEDELMTGIGWGLAHDVDRPSLKDLSQDLRYVNVSVTTLADCGDYYNDLTRNIIYVSENNICTSGYQNKGTCNGDSGSPLLHNGVQVGIVSIGTTLCELCSPSVFTKVGQYLDWIEDHTDVIIH